MLRCWAICSSKALTPVTRVLTAKSIAGHSTARQYSVATPKSAPPKVSYLSLPLATRLNPVSVQRELPELSAPEESKTPLVDSDVPQYIAPLYQYGWRFQASFESENRPELDGLLTRHFKFRSFQDLVTFVGNPMKVPSGNVSYIPPTLTAIVRLHSPEGATRSLIRSAVETEMAYRDFIGSDEGRQRILYRCRLVSWSSS
ncbi:hypothetical protein DFH07DRAFT_789683 [Mycena maculata]|uniref:Uncharacterized protein n=1 Tax=Mycena maculata TaxID=230809 RepID=A0AAD7KG69_9AGAR|nr:hypothetical protein DFH07DRAFT_789683 [Mycena maculata]